MQSGLEHPDTPQVARPRRFDKGRKPFAVEFRTRFRGLGEARWSEWSVWRRYHTEAQAKEGLRANIHNKACIAKNWEFRLGA